MRVGVLGVSEAFLADAQVDLGTPKQRALLTALALHRGRPVPVDTLIDLVWGEESAPGTVATLHTYVAKLRRALEPNRPPRAAATVLRTAAPGYALSLDEGALDAERFECAITSSHRRLGATTTFGLPQASLATEVLHEICDEVDEALALWRGSPFLDLGDAPPAAAERAGLEELRTVGLEDRAAARLALGQHATVAGELESLTRSFPLRERLWALWAVALARSGRQADALDVLAQVRRLLDEELGLEPGPELRELQTAVLRQDPSLAWRPPAGSPAGTVTVVVEPAASAGARGTTADVRRVTASVRTPAARPPWPIVGRDSELALLSDLLTTAEAGTPTFASLLGQPGIGKSRLALELAHEAAGRGVLVALGQCSQDDGAPPLRPWTAVLSMLDRDLPTDAGAEDEGARFRSWEAIADAVLEESRQRPVLIVLDDLHWADVSSLRVLRLLLESAHQASLMVVGTWRTAPEPPGALADVAETLARRHAARVELAGLTSEQAATVIEAVGGEALPDRHLSEDQAVALHERTDGNPFFLVEYARLAGERGDLASLLHEAHPPAAVHDVLVRRVQRLPELGQRLLGTASVIGRQFDLTTLARAQAMDEDDVLDGLDPALEAGLLRLTGPETFLFAHALVRDTVYAGVGSRQARTHARVAKAIAALPGARESELVRHWLAAGPAYAPEARRTAEAAAHAARQVHAYEEAGGFLHTALGVLDNDPAATPRDRYDVLLELCDMQRWAGNWAGLISTAEQAIVAADALGDVELLAHAASQPTIGALWQSAAHGEVHEGVVDALRRALTDLPAADSALRCRTMLALANEIYYGSTNQEREALTEQALAMARRVDDPQLLLDACLISFVSTWREATAPQRLDLATEALELAHSVGNERSAAVSEVLLAVVSAEVGRVDDMWTWARRGRLTCQRLKLPYGLLVVDNLLLPWHAMAGRFDDCEEILAHIKALDDEMSLAQYDDAAAGAALCMSLWQGRSGEVVPILTTLEEQSTLPLTTIVAMFLARAGMVEEASDHLAHHRVDLDHDDWFSGIVWAAAAEAALAVGDPNLAARAYDKLSPFAGRPSCAGSGMHLGPVDGFLALAAAATGERELAAAHADAALAQCEAWDIPLAAAWLRDRRETHAF